MTKWGKAALGTAVGASLLLGAGAAQAASLSQSQIDAITNLLSSFSVSSSTIANVQAVLSGQTTVGALVASGEVNASMIGELRQGAKGDGVCLLQTLLAADPSVYPEGTVSCFFGPLTFKAVKNFQGKHGIEKVGFIGPKTLNALEKALKDTPLSLENTALASSTGAVVVKKNNGLVRVCAKVPPGHLIAPGWLKKHAGQAPIVPQCQTLPPGIVGKIGSSTPPVADTAAPVISSLAAGSLASTSVTVTWTTNESATSKVYYSTTSPIDFGTASIAAVSGTAAAHSVDLTGLTASTTYHYAVVSADAAGNTATSSTSSFTTTP